MDVLYCRRVNGPVCNGLVGHITKLPFLSFSFFCLGTWLKRRRALFRTSPDPVIEMATSTSTPSSSSCAGHRLYRDQNLQSAGIYFFKPNDPAPAELLDLQASLLNTQGISWPNRAAYMMPVSLEVVASGIQPGPEKARYEACMERARQTRSALDEEVFAWVEMDWLELNATVLQTLLKEKAFKQTCVISAIHIVIRKAAENLT